MLFESYQMKVRLFFLIPVPSSTLCFPLQTPQAMWANLAPAKNIPDIMCLWLCPKIAADTRGCDLGPLKLHWKERERDVDWVMAAGFQPKAAV